MTVASVSIAKYLVIIYRYRFILLIIMIFIFIIFKIVVIAKVVVYLIISVSNLCRFNDINGFLRNRSTLQPNIILGSIH